MSLLDERIRQLKAERSAAIRAFDRIDAELQRVQEERLVVAGSPEERRALFKVVTA